MRTMTIDIELLSKVECGGGAVCCRSLLFGDRCCGLGEKVAVEDERVAKDRPQDARLPDAQQAFARFECTPCCSQALRINFAFYEACSDAWRARRWT